MWFLLKRAFSEIAYISHTADLSHVRKIGGKMNELNRYRIRHTCDNSAVQPHAALFTP
jgi:hypothetical protein